jgi:hypothetical protein
MNFEEKAKQLYQQLFGHVDYRISQYVSEETVCSDIATALKEAHKLGRSETKARIDELEKALSFYADEDHWSPSAGGSWINSFNKKDFKEVWNEEKNRWEAPYGYKARAALAKRGKEGV